MKHLRSATLASVHNWSACLRDNPRDAKEPDNAHDALKSNDEQEGKVAETACHAYKLNLLRAELVKKKPFQPKQQNERALA